MTTLLFGIANFIKPAKVSGVDFEENPVAAKCQNCSQVKHTQRTKKQEKSKTRTLQNH